ncbi:hypothetical protein E2562_012336 [Oryza meyeriana var. granulata]|uniref:Major facilitator superfamily (MFS) profile domain-containing protein n=1 Tax=Oryza meyeriana var. granulata TaxID=110450 RepID=A0A6G1DJE8_9ORYZ|nr:hypothetical protein E2562_012336 [Oryza meyeriana var. granulata]
MATSRPPPHTLNASTTACSSVSPPTSARRSCQVTGSRPTQVPRRPHWTREEHHARAGQRQGHQQRVSGSEGVTWKEVATKAGVRRVLAIVLTLQSFQLASVMDLVVVLYGPRVLAAAGVTSDTLLLGLNVVFDVTKDSSILIAMTLTDRVGRRPLLPASTGGMTASPLVLGSVFTTFGGARDDAAVAAVAFVCTFSVGIEPLAWVYSSEILLLRLRWQGTGRGCTVQRRE